MIWALPAPSSHWVGHPISLQVHDVAGFIQDETGSHQAAPKQYPALRCTRVLEEGMVLTIERSTSSTFN